MSARSYFAFLAFFFMALNESSVAVLIAFGILLTFFFIIDWLLKKIKSTEKMYVFPGKWLFLISS